MKNHIAAIWAAVCVAAALVGGVVPAAAQDGRCLDKREIQEKIDSGELRQLSEAMDAAGVQGKIISSAAQVCQVGGRWQWRVNVMDSSGESRPVTLPAQ
jgi:UrcA family protein